MTATSSTATRNLVGRHLIDTQLRGLEVLLAMFIAGVAIVGLLIHLLVEVTGSIWAGAIQLVHWYAAGMGVYLTAVYLPVYLAHGRTRREIATGSATFAVILAVWLGAAVAIGYALEAGLYHLIGWAELLPDPHPLGSVGQILVTVGERSAVFLVFIAVGALAGAAFYRSAVLGLAVVIPCLAAIAATSTLTSDSASLPLDLPDLFDAPSAGLRIALALLIAVLGMAGTWPIVRDMPMRPKAN